MGDSWAIGNIRSNVIFASYYTRGATDEVIVFNISPDTVPVPGSYEIPAVINVLRWSMMFGVYDTEVLCNVSLLLRRVAIQRVRANEDKFTQ